MSDSFRINFRAKVLSLASNPTPESILNVIAVLKKHEAVRDSLVHGLAIDAVLNCTSFQGYDKIQSLLVFAIVIEGKAAHTCQRDYLNDFKAEGDSATEKLVPICNALCHLLVASNTHICSSAKCDSPSASTKTLLQKSKQFFQRALVDSSFVFVDTIWKSFLQVAKVEKNASVDKKSVEKYKFAMIYARSIYDMIPSSMKYFDEEFFDQEIKTLLGDMTFSDLDKWLKDEIFETERQLIVNGSQCNTEPNSFDYDSDRLSSSSFDNNLADEEYNQIVVYNSSKDSHDPFQSSNQILGHYLEDKNYQIAQDANQLVPLSRNIDSSRHAIPNDEYKSRGDIVSNMPSKELTQFYEIERNKDINENINITPNQMGRFDPADCVKKKKAKEELLLTVTNQFDFTIKQETKADAKVNDNHDQIVTFQTSKTPGIEPDVRDNINADSKQMVVSKSTERSLDVNKEIENEAGKVVNNPNAAIHQMVLFDPLERSIMNKEHVDDQVKPISNRFEVTKTKQKSDDNGTNNNEIVIFNSKKHSVKKEPLEEKVIKASHDAINSPKREKADDNINNVNQIIIFESVTHSIPKTGSSEKLAVTRENKGVKKKYVKRAEVDSSLSSDTQQMVIFKSDKEKTKGNNISKDNQILISYGGDSSEDQNEKIINNTNIVVPRPLNDCEKYTNTIEGKREIVLYNAERVIAKDNSIASNEANTFESKQGLNSNGFDHFTVKKDLNKFMIKSKNPCSIHLDKDLEDNGILVPCSEQFSLHKEHSDVTIIKNFQGTKSNIEMMSTNDTDPSKDKMEPRQNMDTKRKADISFMKNPQQDTLALPAPSSFHLIEGYSPCNDEASPSEKNLSSRASSIAESDVLAPLQNERLHLSDISRNNISYERRIEAKQKGMTTTPIRSLSYRSESSGSVLANDEAAKIERRISAKTAGHYDGESNSSMTKYARAKESFSSNKSETSRSSSISTLSKSKGDNFASLKNDNQISHSHDENSITKNTNKSAPRTTCTGLDGGATEDDRSRIPRDQTNKFIGHYRRMSQQSSGSSFYSEDTGKLEQRINAIWQRNGNKESEGNTILKNRSGQQEGPMHRDSLNADIAREKEATSLQSAQLGSGFDLLSQERDNSRRGGNLFNVRSIPRNILQQRLSSRSSLVENDEASNSTTIHDQDIIEEPGDDSGVAIATAIENEGIDTADEAILFDPKSKRRMVNKKMQMWTGCALIAAIAVAVVLGLIFTNHNQPLITTTFEPTSPPTTSYYLTLKQLVQESFGDGKPYDDISTPYGKAFYWLSTGDQYTFDATELLHDSNFTLKRNNISIDDQQANYVHDISTRYFFALFYYQMSGDQWVNCSASINSPETGNCSYIDRDSEIVSGKKNWLSSVNVCAWAGITCDVGNTLIERIELNKLGLKGSIPSEITKVPDLEFLILFENQISGTIPFELGQLKKLIYLDFYSNSIEGFLPDSLYSLTNLISFHCAQNRLNGTISEKIGKLSQLKVLYLFQNELSGIIPPAITSLNSTLEYLSLQKNRLNGSIPLTIENLTNLKEISIGKNNFKGHLNLPIAKNLVTLQVQNNRFDGPLPSNLYKLTKLKYFVTDNNQFTGSITSMVGALSELRILSFRENLLSGTIPHEMSNLSSLEILRLHRNQFNGTIQDKICDNLQNIISFYADCENKLREDDSHYGDGSAEVECRCCTDCCSPGPKGECTNRIMPVITPSSDLKNDAVALIRKAVASEFGSTSIYFEDEESNYNKALIWLTNDKVALIAAEQVLKNITLGGKNEFIKTSNPHIESIFIRYTLALFYHTMSGDHWKNCSSKYDLSTNWEGQRCTYINREAEAISGKMIWLSPFDACSWAGLTCDPKKEYVLKVELNKMGLRGTIPTEISRLKELEYLSLFENEIEGQIPTTIGQMQNLKFIDFFSNCLTGKIPVEMFDLKNLMVLRLSNNAMNGTISDQIRNMKSLQELSIKNNTFSGSFSPAFEELTSLRKISVQQNEFDGQLYLPNSDFLETIQIQENHFNGTLPENLYELKQLKYIVGDANHFTGRINADIGKLSSLSLFSFRDNELSGNIPEEFSKLYNLETLHLHHNKFEGKVAASICQNLKRLSDFYADCLNDISLSDPAVVCECCTDCCMPDVDRGCQKMNQQNKSRNNSHIYQQFGRLYITPSLTSQVSQEKLTATRFGPSLAPLYSYNDNSDYGDNYAFSRYYKINKGKGKKKHKGHYSKKKTKKGKKYETPNPTSYSNQFDSTSTVTTTTTTTIITETTTKTTTTKTSSSTPNGQSNYERKQKYHSKKKHCKTSKKKSNSKAQNSECNGPKISSSPSSRPSVPIRAPQISTSPSLPFPCIDLDNCNRPTNPTTKDIAPQGIPSPALIIMQETTGEDAGSAPKIGSSPSNAPMIEGAAAPTSMLLDTMIAPPDDDDFLASDCDDLDNCNRPTNPTSDSFRFSTNRKPSSTSYNFGHNPNLNNISNGEEKNFSNKWSTVFFLFSSVWLLL